MVFWVHCDYRACDDWDNSWFGCEAADGRGVVETSFRDPLLSRIPNGW